MCFLLLFRLYSSKPVDHNHTGTSLHYACNYNWGDCASLLIDHGASLSKRSAELQLVALHLGERGLI